MPNTSELNFLGVLALGFIPMFVSGVFLRSSGLVGWLSILSALGTGLLIFSSFEGSRLVVSAIAAVGGLTLGGGISDKRERARMHRVKLEEAARREARLRGKSFSE